MASTTRLFKSISRLVFPSLLILVLAVVGASIWIVQQIAQPLTVVYLVTPEKYGQLSSRAAQVTDETWQNRDGTTARGWLLRGTPGAPAVILLHRYGADRSHVLNLGVKLNEATNFTVLMPDQRGHGQNPLVPYSSFGGCETNDSADAIQYLRSIKTPEQMDLVGRDIGMYGIEMGALAALSAMAINESIRAVVLDSVPEDSDGLLASAIDKRFPFASSITSRFGQAGTIPFYYEGCYKRDSACALAKRIGTKQVLLLGGPDAREFQGPTTRLAKCFPEMTVVETKTDLNPSGYNLISASIEVTEVYDQRVIDFLKLALTN